MCGPVGSIAGALLSIFGALTALGMSWVINHDYPYIGEWWDESKGSPHEQKEATVQSLYKAALAYAILLGISLLSVLYNSVKQRVART